MRQLGETIDLSTFDYQSGRHQMLNTNASHASGSNQTIVNSYQRRTLNDSLLSSASASSSPTPTSSAKQPSSLFEFR